MSKKTQNESDVAVLEKNQTFIPKKMKVIIHNDDYTPMEFVIALLIKVFNKNEVEAMSITESVHTKDKGIVGIYPKNVAISKTNIAKELIKQHNQILKITTEEE